MASRGVGSHRIGLMKSERGSIQSWCVVVVASVLLLGLPGEPRAEGPPAAEGPSQQKTVAFVERLRKVSPRDAEGFYQLGLWCEGEGLAEKATRMYERAIRVDPDTQYCVRTPRIGQINSAGRFNVVWTAPQPVSPDPYPKTRTAEEWRAFLHDLYTGWGNRWAAE